MFITEDQLFELKYRLGGKYYGLPLAEIFLKEFSELNKSKKFDLLFIIRNYYHLFNDNEKAIYVKFSDDSIMVIESLDNEEFFNIKIFSGSYTPLYAEYQYCKQ